MIGPSAKLRALVKKYCHTPILVGGQFVAVEDSERNEITRKILATEDELLDALGFQLSVLETANNYLRTLVPNIRENSAAMLAMANRHATTEAARARSAMLCEHANEVPQSCPCDADCVCHQEGTC